MSEVQLTCATAACRSHACRAQDVQNQEPVLLRNVMYISLKSDIPHLERDTLETQLFCVTDQLFELIS